MPVTFSPATRQDRISVFSIMEIERTLRFVMWGYAAPTLEDWMDATESLEMYIGADAQGFAMATWAFPLQGRALPVHFVGARRPALCVVCGSIPTRRHRVSSVSRPGLSAMCSGTPCT